MRQKTVATATGTIDGVARARIFFSRIAGIVVQTQKKATVPGHTERTYALLTCPKQVGMLQDLVGAVSRGPERTASPVSSVEAIFYFFPNDA